MIIDRALSMALPLAHVTYVVDQAKLKALAGYDWSFLLSPLSDPFYVTLIVVTLILSVAAFAAGELARPIRSYCRGIHDRLLEYRGYLPLALRLALGSALVIAGSQDAIYLPNVPATGLGGLEMVLGLCLLVGFMVRTCGLAALAGRG